MFVLIMIPKDTMQYRGTSTKLFTKFGSDLMSVPKVVGSSLCFVVLSLYHIDLVIVFDGGSLNYEGRKLMPRIRKQ